MIAEKNIDANGYDSGTVINDILDSYQLKTKSIVDQKMQKIIAITEKISKDINLMGIDYAIHDLICTVKQWGEIVRPLQLNARAKGTRHGKSEQVAKIIRNLAIKLHNDYGKTDPSIKLIEMLKDVFIELAEISEKAQEDAETLIRAKKKQTENKNKKQMMFQKNKEDKKYSVSLRSDKIVIPPFCTCCMEPTELRKKLTGSASETYFRTTRTRTTSVDFPICEKCKEHRAKMTSRKILLVIITLLLSTVCFALFCQTALEYNVAATLYILSTVVLYVIIGKIIKLPPLSRGHSTREKSAHIGKIEMYENKVTYNFTNWSYATLFASQNEAANAEYIFVSNGAHIDKTSMYGNVVETKSRNKTKDNSFIMSADHPIGILAITIALAFVLMLSFGDRFSGTIISSPTTINNSSSGSSTSKPNSSTTTQRSVTQLKDELATRKLNIERLKTELADMESDLKYNQDMFRQTNDNTYADKYNLLLRDYQTSYDDYDSAITKYNQLVNEYNNLNGK
jgi:hypothetical protein